MKFTFNIEKKHFYFLSVLIAFFGVFAVFVTAVYNPNAPTHPLEQIVTSQGNSVDVNGDGIIDNAEKLGGLTLSELQSQIASAGSSLWTVSGSDISYSGGDIDVRADTPRVRVTDTGENNKYLELRYEAGWGRLYTDGSNIYTNRGFRADAGIASGNYGLVSGEVRANLFRDGNSGFYLDPAGTSKINRIDASIFYDRDNTAYYVNPASTSKFNYINLGGVSKNVWPKVSNDFTSKSFPPGSGSATCPAGNAVTAISQSCYFNTCKVTGIV